MVAETHLDVLHRMLEPSELSAAMGFPEDYKYIGGRTAAKRMIGNAVVVDIAEALVGSILDKINEVDYEDKRV